MMNKILLFAIATGLWANAFTTFVRPVYADPDSYLSTIATDMHALVRGGRGCNNTKICD